MAIILSKTRFLFRKPSGYGLKIQKANFVASGDVRNFLPPGAPINSNPWVDYTIEGKLSRDSAYFEKIFFLLFPAICGYNLVEAYNGPHKDCPKKKQIDDSHKQPKKIEKFPVIQKYPTRIDGKQRVLVNGGYSSSGNNSTVFY